MREIHSPYRPRYMDLLDSGEFPQRVAALEARLAECDLCPTHCKADRVGKAGGKCRSGANPAVASWCDHHGEEPCLSGHAGSGTIFFAGCNLQCVFCQNHQISQNADPNFRLKNEISAEALADRMLDLQRMGCHNINFVSPTHYVAAMARSIWLAAQQGLEIPIVYNSNGYDAVSALELIDGMIDIYLPDIKYASDEKGKRYSGVEGYWRHCQSALKEMHRQVGLLRLDEGGIAQRGMLARHLVLPESIAGTFRALAFLRREIDPRVSIALMSQYYPAHRTAGPTSKFPELSRRISRAEYAEALEAMEDLGLGEGFFQPSPQAPDSYRPDFNRAHPFREEGS